LPTHASSAKRVRSSERKRLRNRMVRSATRTYIQQVRRLIGEKRLEEAEAAIVRAISSLDKAAEKGVIHKNNAARHKSRLVRELNQAKKATPSQ